MRLEHIQKLSSDDGLTTTDKWLIGTLVPLGAIGLTVGAYFFYRFKTKRGKYSVAKVWSETI